MNNDIIYSMLIKFYFMKNLRLTLLSIEEVLIKFFINIQYKNCILVDMHLKKIGLKKIKKKNVNSKNRLVCHTKK